MYWPTCYMSRPASLAETLNETYGRDAGERDAGRDWTQLAEINEVDWEFTHQLFQQDQFRNSMTFCSYRAFFYTWTRMSLKIVYKNSLSLDETKHWADHIRWGDASRNVEDGMKQLYDPKPHLAVCILVEISWTAPITLSSPRITPLHYATLWGLHSMVEFLVIEHLQDVNSQGFTDSVTPLHLALNAGHVKFARLLLTCDANRTAQDGRGMTPLQFASRTGRRENH